MENFAPGDVILLQEVTKTEIGNIVNRKLKNMTFYGIPRELEDYLRKLLEKQPPYIKVSQVIKKGEIEIGEKNYALKTPVFISQSYCTEWLVLRADKENEDYCLYAIGRNAEEREKDYARYARTMLPAQMPTKEEYLTVENVGNCFFSKKAIHTLKNNHR